MSISRERAEHVLAAIQNGGACPDCQRFYVEEHGIPVVCGDCWAKSDKLLPKAVLPLR